MDGGLDWRLWVRAVQTCCLDQELAEVTIELAPLDPSDEHPAPGSLSTALEHAYYQRDVEALRRIAHRAEMELHQLRQSLKQSTP